MKSLSFAAVLACVVLSGCVVAPVGPGYYRHRQAVVVEPAPPVVVVRPPRYQYDRDDGHRHGRPWRRGY